MSGVQAANQGHRLTTRVWDCEEFARSKEVWDGLLAASDADPLFMSWDWQWRWWRHHQAVLGADLRLVAVYSNASLVGLAPFYSRKALVRGVLHPRRMELIGTCWRTPRAAFSDYLDIIAVPEQREQVVETLVQWLKCAQWEELVVCCTRRGSVADVLAQRFLSRIARVREVDPLSGWCAALPERFETYVERLDPEVRRRLFNQRRKLSNPVMRYANENEIGPFLDQLWRFSGDRWGEAGFWPECEHFYRDVAACLSGRGQLRLSRLDTEAGPLSVMLNVLVDKRTYYLQSGFDLARSRGISPGYLHFGYAIEAACAEGAAQFDFLGGSGRHRDYKRDLLTENIPLVTYHAVRGAWARGLYAGYAAWLWARGLVRSR